MADAIFEHPRLIGIYDALHGARDDLPPYVALVEELGGRRVLDLGCGTGRLALRLADRGLDVLAVDPALGSLAVAQAKPGADRVRWVHGDGSSLPAAEADVAVLTGNASQAIVDEDLWHATLGGLHGALAPGGHLVFETRVPARRAWEAWTRERSERTQTLPGVGEVRPWLDLLSVEDPLVTFRWTWVFASDGATLTSESTLRFRERDEVETALARSGFRTVDVRDAPDRPGLEHVFVARRP